MIADVINGIKEAVALLAEGVDRNWNGLPCCLCCAVALLAEGVDRNMMNTELTLRHTVALLAEGVDRNPVLTLKR